MSINQKNSSVTYFVVSYDESLNRIVQNEQIDIQIRYWNESLDVVETRYFDSKFLERHGAENSYHKALSNCVITTAKIN